AFDHEFTGKDFILLGGGLFLITKATIEIHHKIEEGEATPRAGSPVHAGIGMVIAQIVGIDIIFSLDSVITAVGMAKALWVMIAALIIVVILMMAFAGIIIRFIDRLTTMKMLALSFLLLIGVMLVADGVSQHIQRGYIYFAMDLSLIVEVLNMLAG